MGAPVAISVKNAFEYEDIPEDLKTSQVVIKIKWSGEKAKEGVGTLIDNLGEKVYKNSENQTSSKVSGIILETSEVFLNNICKELGFDSSLYTNEKESRINGEIVCETDVDRQEKIAKLKGK